MRSPSPIWVSGLSAASFTFKGFPPKKPGKRRAFLDADAASPHTLVFFESPERVGTFLALAFEVLGDRMAAVCVELTKKFEKVARGDLSDLAARFAGGKVKGEVTVVVAGRNPKFLREGAGPAAKDSATGPAEGA